MSNPALPSSTTLDVTAAAENLGYEPAKSDALGARTVRGTLWTVGSYFGVNCVRLVSNLILTRLLMPELFGVMLIVNAVMTGIRLFSDVGIGPAIISNPRGDDEPFLRTAYTTQAIRGFAIWAVSVGLAIPIAHHYVAEQGSSYAILSMLLPVAGFLAVLEGFRSTAIFRLQRRLEFSQQSLLDLIEMTVTAVGMVVWAAIHKSIWALVVPGLIGALVSTIWSHYLMSDRRDRFGWDRTSSREMMSVGRWIFASTALTFLAGQFDRLLFGGMVDLTTLGIYSIAVSLSIMPTIAVLKIGGSVLFPTFSRVADDPARFANVYARARTMLLVVAGLIVSGMTACGPWAIGAMYKPAYDPAGWMVQLLAIGVWFQIVDATNVAALLARSRPNWMAAGNLTKVVFMVACIPAGYRLFPNNGFAAALVALGIADGARAIISTIGVWRLGISRATLIPDVVFPPIIVGVGLLGLEVARNLAPHLAPHFNADKLGRLLLNTCLCAASGMVIVALWGPACAWQWKKSRQRAA